MPARVLTMTPQRLGPGWLDPPPPGELHIWQAPVRPRPAWLGLLNPAERRRAHGYQVDVVRDTFITSHGVQRMVGARYLGLEPTAVTISRVCEHCGAGHGRPRFVPAGIDYSVSHTRDWLLVAVAGYGRVGVDIERLDSPRDPDGMARVALTAAEHERFGMVPAADRLAWFVAAWTRKEAAMKLTGHGLVAPPDQLEVSGPLVTVGPGRVPGWPAGPIHLHELPAPAGHLAALASTVPIVSARSITLP